MSTDQAGAGCRSRVTCTLYHHRHVRSVGAGDDDVPVTCNACNAEMVKFCEAHGTFCRYRNDRQWKRAHKDPRACLANTAESRSNNESKRQKVRTAKAHRPVTRSQGTGETGAMFCPKTGTEIARRSFTSPVALVAALGEEPWVSAIVMGNDIQAEMDGFVSQGMKALEGRQATYTLDLELGSADGSFTVALNRYLARVFAALGLTPTDLARTNEYLSMEGYTHIADAGGGIAWNPTEARHTTPRHQHRAAVPNPSQPPPPHSLEPGML